jgi:hypothetical protein
MTKAQSVYAPGTRVEVFKFDFSKGPAQECVEAWLPGTVESVEQGVGHNPKLISVHVAMDDGGWSNQIVGPRGGNTKIRVAG